MAYAQRMIHALYKKLLGLYPRSFRERLGESMAQTFNDLWREHQRQHGHVFRFVCWTFAETVQGIVREHLWVILHGDEMKNIASNPKLAALVGFLLAWPFIVLNAIVGNQIEPFLSFIRPDSHTSALEYGLLAVVLSLLPLGAFIAVRPMFLKTKEGKRNVYIFNVALASFLLVGFVLITLGLGADIYQCDVLHIPNCD